MGCMVINNSAQWFSSSGVLLLVNDVYLPPWGLPVKTMMIKRKVVMTMIMMMTMIMVRMMMTFIFLRLACKAQRSNLRVLPGTLPRHHLHHQNKVGSDQRLAQLNHHHALYCVHCTDLVAWNYLDFPRVGESVESALRALAAIFFGS